MGLVNIFKMKRETELAVGPELLAVRIVCSH
jgi:hypothetical protein